MQKNYAILTQKAKGLNCSMSSKMSRFKKSQETLENTKNI